MTMERSASGLSRRWLGKTAAALAATFILSAPSQAQDNWDAVVAAAEKEGKVVFYSNLQPNGIEPLLQKFREAYPKIQTEQIRLGSNPLIERFATEFNAKRNLADVVVTFPDDRVYEGIKNGWATAWTPPELPAFDPSINNSDMLYTVVTSREAIIWNKNLVKPEDAPKEWTDLFDAKWKGKIGMNPPWRSLSVQQVVLFWENVLKLGDTAQKLKDLDVRFFEGSGGVIQAVVRGDVLVAEIVDLPLNPLLSDGAPIGFVYPKSGTLSSSTTAFVAGQAPHPNAAKVLMNWLMTKEGQEYLQEYCGQPATRGDVAAMKHIPPTKDLSNVRDGQSMLKTGSGPDLVDHWRTVFGIK